MWSLTRTQLRFLGSIDQLVAHHLYMQSREMVGANQLHTYNERVNTSNCHSVTWDISERELYLMREGRFSENFWTFCPTSPTSWDFNMSFPGEGVEEDEEEEEDTPSLYVQLKRTDSVQVDLDATIVVYIMNADETLIYPRQSFVKIGMAPGSVLEERVDLVPYPRIATAVHQPRIVTVTLMISSCHDEE